MVRKVEIIFYFVLLAIILLFATQLIVPENDPLQPVDSVDYARVVVGLFGVSVVGQLVSTIKKYRAQVQAGLKAEEKTPEEKELHVLSNKLVFATFFIFLFYCTFFSVIGYYTTGFMILLVYMHILYYAQLGRPKLKTSLLLVGLSFAIVAVLYLVFSVAFELWLPSGILI